MEQLIIDSNVFLYLRKIEVKKSPNPSLFSVLSNRVKTMLFFAYNLLGSLLKKKKVIPQILPPLLL